MTWKVRIVGDANDLRELQKSFESTNICISKEDDGFYLTSDAFNDCQNNNDVLRAASKLLSIINGASRLALGGNTPLKESGVVKEKSDGTSDIYMSLSESISVRDSFELKVIDKDGNVIQEIHPADEVPNWVDLGIADEAVERALRLYGQQLDWVGLYRIYEVIEQDVGGTNTIVENDWSSKTKIKAFKHTANSPGTIGDEARHGKEQSQPPQKPLLLSEARNLVENLFLQWIKSKTDNS